MFKALLKLLQDDQQACDIHIGMSGTYVFSQRRIVDILHGLSQVLNQVQKELTSGAVLRRGRRG